MDQIKRQVARAQRKLIVQQFLAVVAWTLFAGLLLAAAGVAVPRLWAIAGLSEPGSRLIWDVSWVGGGLLAGLIAAGIWTYLKRKSPLEAAIEIDHRFGLKERVSSALTLHPQELETEAGQALLSDAVRRVERVDVRERFGLGLNWRAALPVLPLAAVVVLAFFSPLAIPAAKAKEEDQLQKQEREQTKKALDELRRRVEERKKIAQEKGLEESEVDWDKILKQIDDLEAQKEKLDKKEVMVKLNDIKQEVEEKRKAMGDPEEMKKQLNQLKDIQDGPADKMAEAVKEGDFKKAQEEIENLQEKLRNNELSEEEREQLADQLEQMEQKLNDLADAHEQAKEALEQEIKKKQEQGDAEGAKELQKQLDKLEQQDKQVQDLKELADKLGACKECLKQGDGEQAAQELDDLAQQLGEMQEQLEEMENLDELSEQIAEAKNSMNCEKCNGEGCAACQGQGQNAAAGQRKDGQGDGLGEGQGFGDRPESPEETGEYVSQVRDKPEKGEAVRTGDADGPNIAGRTKEEVKEEIAREYESEVDPQTNQRIPRDQKDHTRQYFEKFNKGS